MNNIWLDGIMGVIVGDALGLPVQFLEREELDKNPVTEMMGYGTFNMPEGTWSDDGSLTLATLESILANGEIDCKDIMENFADWLLDGKFTPFGQSFDQGSTCIKAISNYVRNNNTDTCGITGEWANGNGALMRIMPVCLFAYEKEQKGEWTEEEAVEQLHQVSALTHNHLRSKMACGIYYFMVKSILDKKGNLIDCLQVGMDRAMTFYQKDMMNLTQFSYYGRMRSMAEFMQLPRDEIKSSGYVVDSMEAAVWCLLRNDNFEDTALCAVNLGKDTDTVAAIACGLAGLYYGYQNIPDTCLEKIQQREYIEKLCVQKCKTKVKL